MHLDVAAMLHGRQETRLVESTFDIQLLFDRCPLARSKLALLTEETVRSIRLKIEPEHRR